MSFFRDMFKHSAIYGIGQILQGMASFLLLPFYTAYLSPRDYGIIALLDLFIAVSSHLAEGGIVAAVSRHHFDKEYIDKRRTLWFTAMALTTVLAGGIVLVGFVFRDSLSGLLFGSDVGQGNLFITLALVTLFLNVIGRFGNSYLRVYKRSVALVTFSLSVLVLSIVLNVLFIGYFEWGVMGFLWSGVVAGVIKLAYTLILLIRVDALKIDMVAVRSLWKYGWPMIIAGLASLAMHEADRYLIRVELGDLAYVGLYSLAYKVAQGVNLLLVFPFHSIWTVTLFEIDERPDRKQLFALVFRYYVVFSGLVFLGVALYSELIVRLITDELYWEAHAYIPVICLAFFLFPLHMFFSVPAMLQKRTQRLALTALCASLVNIGANLMLLPVMGLMGAAVASVGGYATYSFIGHWQYRKMEKIPFELHWVALVAAICGGLVVVQVYLRQMGDGFLTLWVTPGLLWTFAAIATVLYPARGAFHKIRELMPKRKVMGT